MLKQKKTLFLGTSLKFVARNLFFLLWIRVGHERRIPMAFKVL